MKSPELLAQLRSRKFFSIFFYGSDFSRVLQNMKLLIDSPREQSRMGAATTGRECLVGALILAFVEGELKSGDPFPRPAELAREYEAPLTEALEAVEFFMNRRIVHQDYSGALRIHPTAVPSVEMKHQAFLLRARQLVELAREWHLAPDGVRLLFDKATREAS